MKMLFTVIALLLPTIAYCKDQGIATIPWPKAVRDFPRGKTKEFTSGNFKIEFRIPDDPEIQAAGGSGGPIVEIKLSDARASWSTSFLPQSVGERLLQDYKGKPQIEIWGRGGGGYWSRCLYRYTADEYRCVRIDEFEETPRHQNDKALTTQMPSSRQGKGDQQSETLYFVETRIPNAD
ncbi:hypothetical protein BH11VER1_BH11VER1_42170 [soil metagenome]